MLIPPEPPRLHISHDADFHWLVALEFGRVGEDQPQGCWVALSDTFAYLRDAPEGRVVGFRVNDFHTFDPDDPEVAAIWDAPRFDAPTLGLTEATAGEIAIAARRRFGDTDSLNRKIFGVATAHQGEEALPHWQHCLEAGDGTAHFALGYTLLGLDRPQEAYGHLRHYTEIAPMGAWNWCWYGQAAEAVGELSEARRAYRRAIELADEDSGRAGADAAERLAGLPAVVDGLSKAVGGAGGRTGGDATAGATDDGGLTLGGDGAGTNDGALTADGAGTNDGALTAGDVAAGADDDADPTDDAERMAFDGRDFPEHGQVELDGMDVHLAAGITAGAHPKAYAHTDVNEDAVRVFRSGDATVVILCDGHRGESSARLAAGLLEEVLEWDPRALHDDDALLDVLAHVNDVVRAQTAEAGQPESRTTLAIAVVEGGRVRWVHLGDSLLAIVAPDGGVTRLGRPRHRFLGWPMDRGGVDAAVERGTAELAPGGWLVLASDGLPDFARPWRDAVAEATEIADVAALPLDDPARDQGRPFAIEVVDRLIDAAGTGGAGDNVAVVVLGRAPLAAVVATTEAGAAGERHGAAPGSRSAATDAARRLDGPSPTVGDRIRGGLLGGAIGDALGAGIEFDDLDRIRRRFGPDGLTDPASAYGRESAITDDTQLALFTAEGLLRAFTRFATKGIAHPPSMVDMACVRWLRTQGEESARQPQDGEGLPGRLGAVRGLRARRGPGRTTIKALRAATAGELDAPTNASKGSGAVARSAPVGLVGDPSGAFRLGCECAVLTHGHPTGYLAAGALSLLIASLRDGVALQPALDRVLAELQTWRGHEETVQALTVAIELAALTTPDAEAVEALGRGWVAEEALAIAVYCTLQARDLEHGVRLAVNHGGASPTTGAICGAILGTLFGGAAIPERWLATLELRDVLEEVAGDLDAAFGEEPRVDAEDDAWWERWPGA